MKRLVSPKLAVMLTTLAMLTALTLPFIGNQNHFQSAHAVGNSSAVSNVLAQFFPNPYDNGTFDVNPSATPAFNQPFSTIDFNPPTSMQSCTNSTGVDENTRPFTDISSNSDGTCTSAIAQSNGQQAGVNNLSSFEAVFIATFSVPQAGQMDMNIYADDGWILSIGKDGNGNQPTYVAGPMNSAPANGKGPFSGNRVIGANNVPSPPALLTVTASFPAAGIYPIEMDYTECCSGALTLVFGDPTPSTVTLTPVPTSTPVPGGTWINPSTNQFVISGDTFHFAAHAYPTNAGDPFVDHVNFTAYFLGVNPDVWTIPCTVTSPTPATTDVYECDWNLSPSIPNGPVTVSFDVYDTVGNKNLAPNGTLQGTIDRPVQSLLLAPVPYGVTVKIIHGYNDPLPSKDNKDCPQPGNGIADHCANQQYGLDLVPTTSNLDIIAPAPGVVAWVSSDCLGLRLDLGDVNLTICHFASFQPKIDGARVARGALLGTMNGHIHISLDERYNDTTHSDCSPNITPTSSPRTCRPIPFNGGYFTIENQTFDPAFNQDGSPIQNQYDTCDANQQNCILITSTNREINN